MQLLPSIIQNAMDAFIVIDADNRVIEWSPQAEKLFGWISDEVMGKPLRDLIGWEPGVTPDHTDHRDVNCGKDVGRRPHQDKRSHQDEQQRCYHKRVGPAKS